MAFDAPSGRWRIEIEETCLQGPCFKQARLKVLTEDRRELQCALGPTDNSRLVFDTMITSDWQNNETLFVWTAGDPAQSGSLNLLNDCFLSAVVHDRPSLVSIRFDENCLTAPCRRRAYWVDSTGSHTVTTPCVLTAAGDSRVFTLPGDPRGSVNVDFEVSKRLINWRSHETGQHGSVVFSRDCDPAQSTRKPIPP